MLLIPKRMRTKVLFNVVIPIGIFTWLIHHSIIYEMLGATESVETLSYLFSFSSVCLYYTFFPLLINSVKFLSIIKDIKNSEKQLKAKEFLMYTYVVLIGIFTLFICVLKIT